MKFQDKQGKEKILELGDKMPGEGYINNGENIKFLMNGASIYMCLFHNIHMRRKHKKQSKKHK